MATFFACPTLGQLHHLVNQMSFAGKFGFARVATAALVLDYRGNKYVDSQFADFEGSYSSSVFRLKTFTF